MTPVTIAAVGPGMLKVAGSLVRRRTAAPFLHEQVFRGILPAEAFGGLRR